MTTFTGEYGIILFTMLTMPALLLASRVTHPTHFLCSSLLVGLAASLIVATKINAAALAIAAPIGLIFVSSQSRRIRITATILSVVALLASATSLVLAVRALSGFEFFLARIRSGSGQYGGGPARIKLIDLDLAFSTLIQDARMVSGLNSFYIVGIGLLSCVVFGLILLRKPKWADSTYLSIGAFCSVGFLGSLLLFLFHPYTTRYLLPAFLAATISIFAILRATARARPFFAIAVLASSLIYIAIGWSGSLRARLVRLDSARENSRLVSEIATRFPKDPIYYTWGVNCDQAFLNLAITYYYSRGTTARPSLHESDFAGRFVGTYVLWTREFWTSSSINLTPPHSALIIASSSLDREDIELLGRSKRGDLFVYRTTH